MSTTRLLILTILISSIAALALHADTKKYEPKEIDPNGIRWYSYEAGWEKAKAENKHMFVDFTAVWCGWCRRLEKTTFSQTPVIKALNDDFVAVKVWEKSADTADIDGYRISEVDLRINEFGVRSYPQLWFVSPKGVRIGPIKGYVQADQLLHYLDIVQYYRYDTTLDEAGRPINKDKP